MCRYKPVLSTHLNRQVQKMQSQLRIRLPDCACPGKVVEAAVEKISQCQQVVQGDPAPSGLISPVGAFLYLQQCADRFLCQFVFLPKAPDTVVAFHIFPPCSGGFSVRIRTAVRIRLRRPIRPSGRIQEGDKGKGPGLVRTGEPAVLFRVPPLRGSVRIQSAGLGFMCA